MDRQTVYKSAEGYYQIHRELLLKKGYVITQDTIDYTVFEERDRAPDNKPEPSVRLNTWA